ncbi:FtsK/SpoIIIE domain-containing protein [Staphylococcus warneri]|uniref:FtsK/SpoIIIE domain-containing protein n=1 Tax=Staphylococcus warneri TaxID=1292 RepID=UPI0022DF7A29|nr:FtsK/SpoIIIE domain-containing protein [Staphylococcus warneri]
MSNKVIKDVFPFSKASHVLWKIGKYIVIFIVAWIILFKFILYWLSLGLKVLANGEVLQSIINIINQVIGVFLPFQIPQAQGAADGFHHWVNHMKDLNTISYVIIALGIVAILYIGTIILRHHNREQAPFINDMEAKLLKRRLKFALGADDDNLYDEDEKRVRKVEQAARRRIRLMRVYIHTRKEQGETVPSKQYTVKVLQPANTKVDDILNRLLRKMPKSLGKATNGVTFGDQEQTNDYRWYKYKGITEAKEKKARSVKKQEKAASLPQQNDDNGESAVSAYKGLQFDPTFPLELFVDRTEKIAEQTEAANTFAERMQQRISEFLISTEKNVTHQSTHVGNASVQYKYRVPFSKNQDSEKLSKYIETGLSDALEVGGIIVQGGSGIIRITLPLKEKDKYDYNIDIDVKSMIEQVTFKEETDMILGITPERKIIHLPLATAPHLLLAGATGSGKSVNIQQMLITQMVHTKPDMLKILIVDPKKTDFAFYEDLPYMLANPIQNMDDAMDAVTYLTILMHERTTMIKSAGAREIYGYNKWAEKNDKEKLPFIVLVIDEYAQLMQMHKEVEEPIKELAQMARATGIHLIIGTQTPRANIITGQVKANIPMRVAMKVSGVTESGIILDQTGAERLKKHGDMLIKGGDDVVERAQGAFISDEEITRIFDYIKEHYDKPVFRDYKAVVARHKGEESDEMYETGKTPNSTSVSVNQNRMKPTPNKSKSTQKSIVGTTKVSNPMKVFRERARKRQLKEEQVNQEVGEQRIGAKYNPPQKETEKQEKPKKKQMDMDFFLGKK